MLFVPLRISSAITAVLRSRCSTFVAARRPANVHPRWTRGRTLRRFCRAACHRSFTTSATVRTTLRVKPCGWVRNQANVCPGGRRASAGAEPAHRENRSRRIAGEEVSQRQPIVGQQPPPGGCPLLDDRRIAGPVRDQYPPELTVVPAEGRNPGDRAVQDPQLAGRRRTRQLCRPLPEHVVARGDPAPKRRNPARLDRPPKDRKGDPVQLDEDDAVDIRIGNGFTRHLAPEQRGGERVVGAGTRQPGGSGAYAGNDPRRPERRPEGGGDSRREPDRDIHQDGLPDQAGKERRRASQCAWPAARGPAGTPDPARQRSRPPPGTPTRPPRSGPRTGRRRSPTPRTTPSTPRATGPHHPGADLSQATRRAVLAPSPRVPCSCRSPPQMPLRLRSCTPRLPGRRHSANLC